MINPSFQGPPQPSSPIIFTKVTFVGYYGITPLFWQASHSLGRRSLDFEPSVSSDNKYEICEANQVFNVSEYVPIGDYEFLQVYQTAQLFPIVQSLLLQNESLHQD